MEKLRINEAIEFAQQTKPFKRKDLAKRVWSQSTDHGAVTNLGNLARGRSKFVNIETLRAICRECGVTADFLLGLEDEPTRTREAESKKQKLIEARKLINDIICDVAEEI